MLSPRGPCHITVQCQEKDASRRRLPFFPVCTQPCRPTLKADQVPPPASILSRPPSAHTHSWALTLPANNPPAPKASWPPTQLHLTLCFLRLFSLLTLVSPSPEKFLRPEAVVPYIQRRASELHYGPRGWAMLLGQLTASHVVARCHIWQGCWRMRGTAGPGALLLSPHYLALPFCLFLSCASAFHLCLFFFFKSILPT